MYSSILKSQHQLSSPHDRLNSQRFTNEQRPLILTPFLVKHCRFYLVVYLPDEAAHALCAGWGVVCRKVCVRMFVCARELICLSRSNCVQDIPWTKSVSPFSLSCVRAHNLPRLINHWSCLACSLPFLHVSLTHSLTHSLSHSLSCSLLLSRCMMCTYDCM
jgi:hypothetical protein